jgi:hypothetical protein
MVMEAARASAMAVNFYQTKQRNIPEHSHVHTCCCGNQKSQLHQSSGREMAT